MKDEELKIEALRITMNFLSIILPTSAYIAKGEKISKQYTMKGVVSDADLIFNWLKKTE